MHVQIATGSNKRCVDRAFSIIRAVLGYDTALPNQWDDDTENRDPSNLVSRSAQAFPDHTVLVWCLKKNWEKSVERQHVEYCGEWIDDDIKWDDYLFTFAYSVEEEKISHMVVGWPVAFGPMQISFASAIRITPPEKEQAK